MLLFLGVYILTPYNKNTTLSQVFIISLIKLVLLFLGVYKLVSLFIGVYNSRESSPYITPRNKSTSLEHETLVIKVQTCALVIIHHSSFIIHHLSFIICHASCIMHHASFIIKSMFATTLIISTWLKTLCHVGLISLFYINKLKSLKVAKWRKVEWRMMEVEGWRMMISSCCGVLLPDGQTNRHLWM